MTGRRGDRRLVASLAGALLGGALAGCGDGEAVSGTGTTTGNTITASLQRPDGSPAAGARVALYPVEYLPPRVPRAAGGRAGPMVAVADSLGRVSIPAEAGAAYRLVGEGGGGEATVLWKDSLYLRVDEDTTHLGAMTLAEAASLSGTVTQPEDGSAREVWAGFRGTDVFTRADETGFFRLTGIPPGAHELLVLRDPVGEGGRFLVRGWRLAPGSAARLDTLALPATAEAHLAAEACRENPTVIREYAYEGPAPGPSGRLLRSIRESDPPRWIEIDPCLGTWRDRGVLPAEVFAFTASTSSHDADFLALDDSGWTLRIDSTGNPSRFLHAPPSLLNAQFYRGRVYAIFKQDSALKVYADESAYLENRPVESLPLGRSTASLSDLAVVDSVVYFAETDGTPRYLPFDLRKRSLSDSFEVPGFQGRWYSFTSAPDGGLWVLNDSALLHFVDLSTRTVTRTLQVDVHDRRIRALTRFHPLEGDP